MIQLFRGRVWLTKGSHSSIHRVPKMPFSGLFYHTSLRHSKNGRATKYCRLLTLGKRVVHVTPSLSMSIQPRRPSIRYQSHVSSLHVHPRARRLAQEHCNIALTFRSPWQPAVATHQGTKRSQSALSTCVSSYACGRWEGTEWHSSQLHCFGSAA